MYVIVGFLFLNILKQKKAKHLSSHMSATSRGDPQQIAAQALETTEDESSPDVTLGPVYSGAGIWFAACYCRPRWRQHEPTASLGALKAVCPQHSSSSGEHKFSTDFSFVSLLCLASSAGEKSPAHVSWFFILFRDATTGHGIGPVECNDSHCVQPFYGVRCRDNALCSHPSFAH